MNFDEMGLHPKVLRAVTRDGYSHATPIQSEAIPLILAGHDVLGIAQTGTGKTAAFALPTLDRLFPRKLPNHRKNRRNRWRPIKALVLTPTRELAVQVQQSFATYGRCTDLQQTVIYGGVSQSPQVEALQAGTDIIIATPGRLLDLIGQGHVKLQLLEILVLDEADQMLDMGFLHDLKKILQRVPQDRQTLMFSATMPAEIRRLATQWLNRPKTVQATPEVLPPDAIQQKVAFVEEGQKPATLVRVLQGLSGQRNLVFCRTKRDVDRVVQYLKRAEIYVMAIHGNKRQNARHRVIERFCSPRPPVLIATDVAARGLHMPNVSHVINFNVPEVPETYVHRIGRTARAGAAGTSISFCSAQEKRHLKQIEELVGQTLIVQDLTELNAAQPAENQQTAAITCRSASKSARTSRGAAPGDPRRVKEG